MRSARSAAAALALLAHASAAPQGACPAGVATACAADGSQTCCPIFMSGSGFGCCNLPGASCCPASATTQGCCPAGTRCILTGAYSATCEPLAGGANVSAVQVCTPGAKEPPSATAASLIYIGDSVSFGATPALTALVAPRVFLQHSPWGGGGGADDIVNGLNCEDAFLRTAMYKPAAWDGILFNFGLHDLYDTPAARAFYAAGLANFTARLRAAQPRAKLAFVTTTPFMPDRFYNNTIVEDNNAAARAIMAPLGIPVIDTYAAVVAHCGAVYSSCDICDDEPNAWPKGAPAGAHCGYREAGARAGGRGAARARNESNLPSPQITLTRGGTCSRASSPRPSMRYGEPQGSSTQWWHEKTPAGSTAALIACRRA